MYIGNQKLTNGFANGRFDTRSEKEQDLVVRFAEEYGISLTDLRNDVYSRMHLFVRSLLILQDRAPKTFKYRRGAFTLPVVSGAGSPVKPKFRMIFAGDTTTHHDSILTMCGAVDRLWSYYSYRNGGDRILSRIAEQASAVPYVAENRTIQKTNWKSKNYHDHRRRQLVTRAAKREEYVEGSD